MSLTSPALQRAQDALLARRANRQTPGYKPPVSSHHDALQVAYRSVGEGRAVKILYCPCCLRGHAVDLVREVPAGAADAVKLELKQMRPWRLECPEKLSTMREVR